MIGKKEIPVKHPIGSRVFLKTDPHQSERMVTRFTVSPDAICYEVALGEVSTSHYDLELTSEPNQNKKLGIQ